MPMPTPKSKMSGTQPQISGRRSKQARSRAMKMRRMYGLDRVRVTVCRMRHTYSIMVKCDGQGFNVMDKGLM